MALRRSGSSGAGFGNGKSDSFAYDSETGKEYSREEYEDHQRNNVPNSWYNGPNKDFEWK